MYQITNVSSSHNVLKQVLVSINGSITFPVSLGNLKIVPSAMQALL